MISKKILKKLSILLEGFFILVIILTTNSFSKDIYWIHIKNKSQLNEIKTKTKILYFSRWLNVVAVDTILPEYNISKSIKYRIPKENEYNPIIQKKLDFSTSPYSKYFVETTLKNYRLINILPLINYFDLSKLPPIKIGVIDNGFITQSSYFDSINIIKNLNFTTEQLSVKPDNHGTAVLSLIGANKEHIIKTAGKHCNFYLIKTEISSSESIIEEYNLVHAIEYLVDTAKVNLINISLGYRAFDDAKNNLTKEELNGDSTIVAKIINIAFSKNVITVVAAGNEALDKEWPYITSPADAKDAISVGNIQENKKISPTSSIGIENGNMKPNIVAIGENVGFFDIEYNMLSTGSGTSFSSPIVTGSIAMIMRLHPNWNAKKIKSRIEQYSSNYNNPDYTYGYGIPNFLASATDSTVLCGFIYKNDTIPINNAKIYMNNKYIASTKEDGFFYYSKQDLPKSMSITLSKTGFNDTTIICNTNKINTAFLHNAKTFKILRIFTNTNTYLGNFKIIYNNDSTTTNYDGSFYIPDSINNIIITNNGFYKSLKNISDSIINIQYNENKTILFVDTKNNKIQSLQFTTEDKTYQTNSEATATIYKADINKNDYFYISPTAKNQIFSQNKILFNGKQDTIIVTEKISIFPNPLQGNVLYIGAKSNAKVYIYNISGKKMSIKNEYDLTTKTFKLDFSNMSSGIYIAIIDKQKFKIMVLH